MTDPRDQHDAHEARPHDDDWFVHTSDEPHAQEAHGKVNESLIGATLLFVIIGTAFVIAIFMGYVPRVVNSMKVVRQELRDDLTRDLRAKQEEWAEELAMGPGWQTVETDDGEPEVRLRIPWEMARQAVIRDYAQGENK